MKRLKWPLCGAMLAICPAFLSACDMANMPSKMDTTNAKMDQTNTGINKTVDNMEDMKTLLAKMMDALNQTNGNMQDMKEQLEATRAIMQVMQEEMSNMNGELAKTNLAIHTQILVDALKEMLTPANSTYLSPPTGMMPAGQKFADEATADEVVQLTYVYLKDINEVQPDDSQRVNGHFPDTLVTQMDHDKLVKLTALEVIAGFASQDVIADMATRQVSQGGRYDQAAKATLMLRASFIGDLLIGSDLFANKLDDLGKVDEAISRVSNLDWMARLSYVGQIGVKTTGMLKPDDNVEIKFDPRVTVSMWDRLQSALTNELDPAKLAGVPDAQAKVDAYKAKVKAFQDSWKGH